MPKISYRWLSVELENGAPFEFSESNFKSLRRLSQKPAVYRWAVYEKKILRKVYIGEAENLRDRVDHYFKPGTKPGTDLHLNKIFSRDVAKGANVRLEVLHIDPIYLNNVYLCDGRLADQYIRKMMENFTLADSDVTQYQILNATLNPIERRKRKAMKDNPLEALFQEHGLAD
ncbi:MAG: hypothetical protein ABSC62_02025 [Terracidiphilus sp.]|jgi:hypothetical protein